MSLTKKILVWMVIGIIVGLIFNLVIPGAFDAAKTYVLIPLGKLFINLIKMLVVPLVLFSIILGAAGVGNPKTLGRIGAKTIGYFLVTTAIALVIAISLAFIIQPGVGDFQLDSSAKFEAKQAPPIMDTLLNIVPTNPIKALAEGEMLQIITFALLVGIGLSVLGEKTKGILNWVEQANEIMMYLVNMVMKLAPYGAFALIAKAIGEQGIDAIMAMGAYMIVVLLGLLIHAGFTWHSRVRSR
jgi:Na+/H+-dicarboxylate symporter